MEHIEHYSSSTLRRRRALSFPVRSKSSYNMKFEEGTRPKRGQRPSHDPTINIDRKIAIVGIGCRYANGVDNVAKFWDMLAKGLDCSVPPPPDRFDTSYFLYPGNKIPGKMYNKNGGYLTHDPKEFDRQFFRMSPEEANHLDPQVRLLLEVVWESLENAGIPVSSARGSNTGVYIGLTASEYGILTSIPNENINQYTNSGINSAMAANRISYEFDFHGPSYVVDTACSSSMYSVHLACEAIRNGDCDMALAGGVNISLMPVTSIGFCQAGMLSPDGKCKSFDKSADGYARAEGAGIVVLKSLQRAINDGDRIYSVIRGGALCNDGRTPGIANPSYESQVALIETAYQNAKVHPEEVQYVEAHGTGTQIGDKTEANAIGQAMGLNRRPDQPPLYLASVKSNFGHSEGASGVAGVIKTALSLYFEQIPKAVHFREGNEAVDFEGLNLRVPTELTRWPKVRKRLAGCSSFGFGGANAHIVMEAYPYYGPRMPDPSHRIEVHNNLDTPEPRILFLSAANKDALLKRLDDWVTYLNNTIGNDHRAFTNSLYTASVRSFHHQYRMGIIARSAREAVDQIRLKLDHDPRAATNVVEGKMADGTSGHRLVFVFSGMGTQWWGMARNLMEDEPAFRNIIKRIDKSLTKCGAKWSLVHTLTKETDKETVNITEIAQPSIFAVQIGLAELYRQRGVTPDAVIGHSVGEVAAAHVAGLITLDDAIKIIYHRGRQLRKTTGRGSMVAVLHAVEEIQTRLDGSEYVSVVDVAAVNSPTQIVLSGETEALSNFADTLRQEGLRCTRLHVANAFHSYQQDHIRKDFIKKVKFLSPSSTNRQTLETSPIIPMMSTVTNQILTRDDTNTGAYWWKNIRGQVKFMSGIEKLLQEGYNCFLEIGPHPSLSPAVRDVINSNLNRSKNIFITGSLRRPTDTRDLADDRVNLLRSLAKLHVEGYSLEPELLFNEQEYKVMSLPTYPWQRVLCSAATETAKELFLFPVKDHPLLGKPLETSHFHDESTLKVWRSDFTIGSVPWLRDHYLQGSAVIPAAAHTETALAAARAVFSEADIVTLRWVNFERFIFTPDVNGTLETTIEIRSKEAKFSLRSYNPTEKGWTLHGSALIDIIGKRRHSSSNLLEQTEELESKLATDDIRRRCPREVEKDEFYAVLRKGGFELGENFKCVTKAYFSHDYNEALVYGTAQETLVREFDNFVFHPAFLDSVFQGIGICTMFQEQQKARTENSGFSSWFKVPRAVERVLMKGKAPARVVFNVQMMVEGDTTVGYVVVADAANHKIFAQFDRIIFENVNSPEPDESIQLWRREWVPVYVKKADIEVPTASTSKGRRSISYIPNHPEEAGAIVIFKDKNGVCLDLKKRLEVENVVSMLDPRILADSDERFRRVLRSLGMVTDLIVLSTLDVRELGSIDAITEENFDEAQNISAIAPLSLYKAVSKHDAKTKPRIWLVTRSAHAVLDIDPIDPMASTVQALGMTLMHEDPELQVFTIDLPAHIDQEESAIWLYNYMKAIPTDENHVVMRRRVPRRPSADFPREMTFEVYSPRVVMEPQSSFSAPTLSSNWIVNLEQSLKAKRLLVKQDSDPPVVRRPEDVLVKAGAFAVQYQYDEPDGNNLQGYLFAGKIVHCTEEVHVMLRTRNTVLGFKAESVVTSTICTAANELVPVPGNLTPTEAINIVKDYLPAFVAFHDTLKLNENGSVIVYLSSLSDRIGLATTHLALEQGANVFIHVENDENIFPVEKLLGILGDSRVVITSPDNFESMIQDNEVDVLLLAGGMIDNGFHLDRLIAKLKPFGTIVQIPGKNGENECKIGVLPPNIYFIGIDMGLGKYDQMRVKLQDSMTRLLQMFSVHNDFQALKSLAIPTAQMSKLAKATHASLDDITVCVDEDSISATLKFEDIGFQANPDASYLVTGGSKGIGLELVGWLVNSGASHIYVVSRFTPEEEAISRFKVFRDSGARITHLKADLMRFGNLEKALCAIKDNGELPLEGIFHCATVYHDMSLRQIQPDRWKEVVATKGFGALSLHQLSMRMNLPIKYFVMFSSIVEMIGNGGQGCYCAANAFLSSLCSMRRKMGLPATVICPGVINTAGFAARKGYIEQWEKNGLMSISPSDVLRGLGCMLVTDYPELGLTGPVNRKMYAENNRVMLSQHFKETTGTISIFKNLFPSRDTFLATEHDLKMKIRLLSPTEATNMIMQTVSNHIAQRLGITNDISEDSSPIALGLDSHMSSELSSVIHENFGVSVVSIELLNDNLTMRNLTQSIYKKIMSGAGEQEEDEGADQAISPASGDIWYRIDDSITAPQGQVVCFPSVGGGPSMFIPWRNLFAQYNVQTIMLQLPGWEGREREKPQYDMQEIVSKLSEVLAPRLIKNRFVFFGHSLGALIAFETAHHIMKQFNSSPVHLFISAWYAPTLPYPHPDELDAPTSVYRKLRRVISSRGNVAKNLEQENVKFSFLDQATLNNSRLMSRMIPSIEAAIMTCKKYRCRHKDRLPCNITTFGGKSDPFINPSLLDDWHLQQQEGKKFKKIIMPGKHMFINTNWKTIVKEVGNSLPGVNIKVGTITRTGATSVRK
ncbi:phthiocerol/phenolphthiocerol synthesis polyketide synthase type I PpsD-like [Anneissia japonica]|uniref:phthiocerol/phenolphthiocerol synthesis polyketide synthase type I PpsD-like n=1 Tax=Anneissia japonica TaxID=1529436 RepID=UPI00142559F3|nr:phthiocerol/phenolphthiocerol synthesis polyketide synthase type I PpsD-like [Anneissia japonica]